MSEGLVTSAVTVVMAIIALAVIAVLVSRNANTSGVIGAGSQGLAQDIGAAVSPLSGGGLSLAGFSGGAA